MAATVWYWQRTASKDLLLTPLDFTTSPDQPFQATAQPAEPVKPQIIKSNRAGRTAQSTGAGSQAGKEKPAGKAGFILAQGAPST